MNLKQNLTYLFICLSFIANAQFYNGSQTSFGKNRVQYKKVDWSFYKFKKFDVYYHLGGEKLALFTATRANLYIEEMQKAFDYTMGNKLQFIVYNNLVDFEQSNIGFEGDEQYNIGGVTKVIGSKVLFYFDGNYYNFEKQIKEGIARVLVDKLVYGGDIKDMVKNSTLIHFPDWYLEGLVSFFSEDWSPEKDNLLQDGILSKRFLKFNHLSDEEHILVGHAMWKYIADKYGKKTLPNILYMSEITRDIDGGFLFVTGKSLSRIRREWFLEKSRHFKDYLTDKTVPNELNKIVRSRKQEKIVQIKLNNKGDNIAYVTNNSGKFTVTILNLNTNKITKAYKRGFKQNEFRFYEDPLILWSPDGTELFIIDRKKEHLEQLTYNLSTQKTTQKTIHQLDQVLSVEFSKNGQDLLMSAVKNGQSDIFVLNNRTNNLNQITNDIYTDNYPSYLADNSIIFSSDRVMDSVQNYSIYRPKNNFDLYQTNVKADTLIQITKTPFINEIHPQSYFGSTLFISDENGTNNKYELLCDTVKTDSTINVTYKINAITNNLSGVLDYSLVKGSKRFAELTYQNGRYNIFVFDTLSLQTKNIEKSFYSNRVLNEGHKNEKMDSLLPTSILTEDNIIISVEGVLKEAKANKKVKKGTEEENLPINLEANTLPNERIYNTVFFADYFMSQLDNSLINQTYQAYNPNFPIFFTPGLNGFIKVGVSDLFEDKRLVGGFKVSGDLSANEYLFGYSNLKNRLDKQFSFQRQSTYQYDENLLFGTRLHIHNLKALIKYPFNRISAISASANFRFDRKVDLPDNNTTLAKPITYDNWPGLSIEYVFDNTVSKGLNLFYGTRAKAHFETFTDLKTKNSYSYIFGLDLRKYTKLYREIILANRFSSGTSLGTQKVVYYLGGVDSWFTPIFNSTNDIPIDQNQNYIYQTIVPNMRGFAQNIRNGNSYAVFNSEVRIPIVRVLSENPVSSDFFYNLQFIGFYDIGTAWTGPHPFSNENSLNLKVIEKTPVTIRINNNIDPIVQGYGFGVRSRVGGYFIRADWGFGVEEGQDLNNQFYLSLSLDF